MREDLSSFSLSVMDSPVGKLQNFVTIDEAFGYVDDVETAYQVLREFETRTTTRFCSFYSKDFGKQDQGTVKKSCICRTFSKDKYCCVWGYKDLNICNT